MSQERNALALPGYTDGIDISQVQTISDANAVYAAGFRFAIVKASEGVSYCDPRAREHCILLADAGLLVTVYSFARPSQDRPREQARRLIDCAGEAFVFRPVLDLESAPAEWSSGRLLAFAQEWCDEMARTQARPVVYSYTSFLQQRFTVQDRAELLALGPLWLAQYRSVTTAWAPRSEFDMPKAFHWDMWQYSGNGGYRVPGIVGDCDRNLFRGDEVALQRWFGLTSDGEPEAAIVRPDVPLGRPALDD
jgi:GH25 family lysozyme M1 (1,4-beta-N-acetylmuramidase)